ncbi:MAG: sigma-70 family RNA polymerase sigma factor [Bacteroidetes bacterium]|nr:sigma-70 family RNA polymerase sigma factor [Bacteroidota bacterium]
MHVSLSQSEDQVLLAAFHNEASRERAFTGILEKYSERLYWHIRRLVLNHDDAHDVLQNLSIRAWRGLADFRGDSSLYTWLYRIATNEALTFLEQKKRRAALSLSDHESSLENQLRAEPGFDARKLEWQLLQAIQSLPEKQRIVFNLRYYDEMPYEQMSDVTGTSVGALKASYHHAVKKIEAYFKNIPN